MKTILSRRGKIQQQNVVNQISHGILVNKQLFLFFSTAETKPQILEE